MTNPYINTALFTTVILHPSQLNNNLYLNIKQNLIDRLEKKCYKNYGYIIKIFKVLEIGDGKLVPEDISASVTYNVKFSCKLCHPLEDTYIICKIEQITDVFITLRSDPISVLITQERINGEKFYKDRYGNIKVKNGSTLTEGTFMKVKVLTKSLTNGETTIIVIGFLEDIATDDEVSKYYENIYQLDKQTQNLINLEEYVKKVVE